MTKFETTLKNFVDKWFDINDNLTQEQYEMLRTFASEVNK